MPLLTIYVIIIPHVNSPYKTSIDQRLIFYTINCCYSDCEYCHLFAIAVGDSLKYQLFVWCAERRCAYGSFKSGDIQQQWRTWGMIWPLSPRNNSFVYGQKHKVWALVFLVRMSGTRWCQFEWIWRNFLFCNKSVSCTVSPFKWRCLILSLTSSTLYDVICLTKHHDQFEHSNCSKEHDFCERSIFIHAYR